MVHVGPSGAVFVKTLEFYSSQGGLTEEWGTGWTPVMATDLDEARRKGCELPGAKPYAQQAR